jgi:hypothetical protein
MSGFDKYEELVGWETPVIIESHISGITPKSKNKYAPIGHEEVAEDAIRCLDAGACAIHFHNSDFSLKGEVAYEEYMKTWDKVAKVHPNALWYGTTIDSNNLAEKESGLEHVALLAQRAGIKLSCLDPGFANISLDIDEAGHFVGIQYGFNIDKINQQVKICNDNNVGIVWGIYEPGYLRAAMSYTATGLSPKGSSLDYYLFGEYGASMKKICTTGAPAVIETIYLYRFLSEGCDLPWYISIWGGGDSKKIRKVMKRAIEMGGHVKVGLEMFYDPERQPTNVELLQEAQEIAKEVGRPLATPEQARKILGIERVTKL